MKPTLVCPACRAVYDRRLEAPVTFACPSCSIAMQRAENGLWAPGKPLPRRLQVFTPDWLQPGARLMWQGNAYTVYACFLYTCFWNEWDTEDHRWTDGVSDSLEWYAVSEDDQEICIEYDDHKHFIRQQVTSVEPDVSEKLASSSKAGWVEYGTFNMSGMVGEDEEALDLRTYEYTVLKSRGRNSDLFVEWLKGDESTRQYYTYIPLRPSQLQRMRLHTSAVIARAEEALPRLSFLRYAFGFAALFFLAMSIFSLTQYRQIARGSMFFSNRLEDSTATAPQSLGIFKVQQSHPYRFNASCTFTTSNSGASFSVKIVRLPDLTPVNTIGCSFYTESGVDSDGSWTESELSDDFYFTAAEDGEYEIIAYNVDQFTEGISNGPVSGKFYATVSPFNLSRYYLVALLVMTLVWLIFQWQLENKRMEAEIEAEPWLHQIKDALSEAGK